MALIRCPECNHEISDTAKFCPNCGYVMKPEEKVSEERTETGTWTDAPPQPVVEEPKKKIKSKKKPLAAILVIVAIVAVFFGINSIIAALNSSKWTTVEHLGLKFDVPGYYGLKDTSDGSIWYEAEKPGFHLYYINGYTLVEGCEGWVMDNLNLAWDNLQAGDSVEDTTANGQSIHTKKYSGKMFSSDVNGEISILPCTDKGTYVFAYLEYAGDTKYEEDYHKILQSITESPETLPNTQIAMKEITCNGLRINVPEFFDKDTDVSDTKSLRYNDAFSRMDIESEDMSGLSIDEFISYMTDGLKNPIESKLFQDGDVVDVDNVQNYETNDGDFVLGEYTVSGAHVGKSWIVGYFNTQTETVYLITMYGSSVASGYINKYHDILQSIKFDQPSSDIKAIADGFEAFMNKYIDFMVAVKNGSSSLSALGEYSELLTEYADWMTKIDSINTDNLSAQDAAYFTEVYARVMSKLASAGLSN